MEAALSPLLFIQNRIKVKTSLTECRHKMRSGDLPAYFSVNGPSNGGNVIDALLFNFSLNVLQMA